MHFESIGKVHVRSSGSKCRPGGQLSSIGHPLEHTKYVEQLCGFGKKKVSFPVCGGQMGCVSSDPGQEVASDCRIKQKTTP